jgi:hypothetical protein
LKWAGRYRRDFGCLILDFEWKSQPAAAEAILQHQKFKIQNSKFQVSALPCFQPITEIGDHLLLRIQVAILTSPHSGVC